ncbi:MAG: TraR/DksA C4-type zinc finger protein [Candidatus Omnitrophica bacterium]|nr:TraR/DksA C4-type zinc finger protein [Candidatus Omnitrophota bacterium]
MAKAKKAKLMRKAKRSGAKAAKPKMKKMPKTKLKFYQALLVKEREKVGGGLSHIAETTLNKSQRDASGDLSGYSYHMADMASDDYERDFSLGRATDEQKILYAIDEAMKRIEDGSYGNCLQCGKAIPKKRLKVLPYTELCIECKKTRENK